MFYNDSQRKRKTYATKRCHVGSMSASSALQYNPWRPSPGPRLPLLDSPSRRPAACASIAVLSERLCRVSRIVLATGHSPSQPAKRCISCTGISPVSRQLSLRRVDRHCNLLTIAVLRLSLQSNLGCPRY